jgi:hypothetical protein
MIRTQENTETRNREEVRLRSCESSTNRLVSSEVYDALDLRLMDTFPASDAVAQY